MHQIPDPTRPAAKTPLDLVGLRQIAEAAATVTTRAQAPLPLRPDREAWPSDHPILVRLEGGILRGLLPEQVALIEALRPEIVLALLQSAMDSAAQVERMRTALRDALVSVAYVRSTLPGPLRDQQSR